jgi:hypothetical protein
MALRYTVGIKGPAEGFFHQKLLQGLFVSFFVGKNKKPEVSILKNVGTMINSPHPSIKVAANQAWKGR